MYWIKSEKYSLLRKQLEIAVEWISEAKKIFILTHKDVDGVNAYFILQKLMLSQGKNFSIENTVILSQKKYEQVKLIRNVDLLVFADLGSSYCKRMNELEKRVIILDHHEVEENSVRITERVVHINPYFWEERPFGQLACGASLSYLLARKYFPLIEKENFLVHCLLGIQGDRQEYETRGVNREIMNEAEGAGLISWSSEPIISNKKIAEYLLENFIPYYKDLFGNREKVLEVLKKLNIKNVVYNELSEEEKKILKEYLHNKNLEFYHRETENKLRIIVSPSILGNIIYQDLFDIQNLLQFSKNQDWMVWTLELNRNFRSIREAYKEVLRTFTKYLRYILSVSKITKLGEEINYIEIEGKLEFPALVIGIFNDYLIKNKDRIIILQKNMDYENCTLSVRAKKSNIYNFGKCFQEVSLQLKNGEGGGHKSAAGMRFHLDSLKLFKELLPKRIKEFISLEDNLQL